jgi:hypothetical protein
VTFKTKIKKIFGLLPQEYVCAALEDVTDHPSVVMTTRDSMSFVDVTSNHILLGYKPLVIAIKLDDAATHLSEVQQICLIFINGDFKPDRHWRGFATSSRSIARLLLTKVKQQFNVPGLTIFTGDFGEHSFLPIYQAWANKLVDMRRKQSSEANLDGNGYEQVRIAYCVPRTISVITVKDGDLMNFFPTDLHGAVGDHDYLSSLRIGGMACNQVETLKRVVISRVDVDAFRQTYSLGKNHMKPLQPLDNFDAVHRKSQSGIPLYPHATEYFELERTGHHDIGIHRLFSYRIIDRGRIHNGKTLSHIHKYYAQWRINHRLSAEYFYR